nr:hypothetical protein [Tanacetum cinerariifolium]
SKEMGEVDIEMLMMEQYLGLVRSNQRSGIMTPMIRGNVKFEIKSQILRELRDNTFFGNKDEYAYKHVEMVMEISSLFSTPIVSNDAIMLRMFPLTLTGQAKRWMRRLPT